MSELYDRADNMFGELVIPESFSEALSYAEQLIWLYLHKQNELIEGENITITDNGDGTATISASMDGVKGIDRIESTVQTDKTVVVVYYTDGTFQSFNVLAGPQGPQGIQGIPGQDGAPGVQGDPGNGIKSIETSSVVTEQLERHTKFTEINPSTGFPATGDVLSHINVPKRAIMTVTYDDDTTDTFYVYAGATTYLETKWAHTEVTPHYTQLYFKMYDPTTNTTSDVTNFAIYDGAQGPQGIQGVPGQDGADGQDGAPGATGATPNITMTASVLPTAGIPDVQISKTGTDENPNFALQFSGLKGADGQNGQDGQNGVGVPAGGYTGYILTKNSTSDYDTKWSPSLSGIGKLSISSTNWYTWREDGGTVTIQSNTMLIDNWLFFGARRVADSNCTPGYVSRFTINFRTFNIVSDMSASNSLGNISSTIDIAVDPRLGYGKLIIGGQSYGTQLLTGSLAWLILTDSNSNVITVPVYIDYKLYVLSYNSSTYRYSFKFEISCMLDAPLKAGTYTSAQLRR